MKMASPGEEVIVGVDEIFGIQRPEHASSGYRTRVEAPSGVVHVGTDRSRPMGFADAPKAVERLRCGRKGTFEISIIEQRPWDDLPASRWSVRVRCA